ncbi:MAG: hypothetical protein PHC86_07045 [Eubacteriales bacterium]|nr:hypothetical protein [Eubacteriales bacterium]
MRDLNFFINPHAKRQQTPIARIMLISIAVTIVIIAGITYYLFDQTIKLSKVIGELEAKLSESSFVVARAELDLIKQKIAIIDQYDQSLNEIDAYLLNKTRLDLKTINLITESIPTTVTYNLISATNSEMTLEVISIEDQAKAQLLHNLKATDLFSNVEMQSSSLIEDDAADPNNRILVVNCTFKEVEAK